MFEPTKQEPRVTRASRYSLQNNCRSRLDFIRLIDLALAARGEECIASIVLVLMAWGGRGGGARRGMWGTRGQGGHDSPPTISAGTA